VKVKPPALTVANAQPVTVANAQPGKRVRTPTVAAVRRIEPQRATRVWSLLLPPTFPIDRK
jgi:hypothetical protein